MNSDSEREGGASPAGGAPESGPVLLVRLYNPVEAEIVVAKLRSSGIEVYLKHDALSVVYGLTIDGCGQQDIMVRAEDLEEARAALEVGDEPDSGDEPESGDEPDSAE
jgi:hypothetical protein